MTKTIHLKSENNVTIKMVREDTNHGQGWVINFSNMEKCAPFSINSFPAT